jgi:hypothetical protein
MVQVCEEIHMLAINEHFGLLAKHIHSTVAFGCRAGKIVAAPSVDLIILSFLGPYRLCYLQAHPYQRFYTFVVIAKIHCSCQAVFLRGLRRGGLALTGAQTVIDPRGQRECAARHLKGVGL